MYWLCFLNKHVKPITITITTTIIIIIVMIIIVGV